MKGRAETQIRGKPDWLLEINPCGKARAKQSDKCALFISRNWRKLLSPQCTVRIPGTLASIWPQSAARGGVTDSRFHHDHLPYLLVSFTSSCGI